MESSYFTVSPPAHPIIENAKNVVNCLVCSAMNNIFGADKVLLSHHIMSYHPMGSYKVSKYFMQSEGNVTSKAMKSGRLKNFPKS